ncbi:hypothetical protein DMUE_2571 [Dictyocoela muelleri]|nr:hypothetical protein DMUE_2571 [Dictyocoela muelleri]
MNNKSGTSYNNVFAKFKELTNLNPEYIVSDFELGLVNSVRRQFLIVSYNGCYFHYSQSIWRRIQQMELSKLYKNNAELRKIMKKNSISTFLKNKDVFQYFMMLKKGIVRYI